MVNQAANLEFLQGRRGLPRGYVYRTAIAQPTPSFGELFASCTVHMYGSYDVKMRDAPGSHGWVRYPVTGFVCHGGVPCKWIVLEPIGA